MDETKAPRENPTQPQKPKYIDDSFLVDTMFQEVSFGNLGKNKPSYEAVEFEDGERMSKPEIYTGPPLIIKVIKKASFGLVSTNYQAVHVLLDISAIILLFSFLMITKGHTQVKIVAPPGFEIVQKTDGTNILRTKK